MNSRMLVALGLAIAMVPLLPAVQASHTGWYVTNPVEHDDQGRSYEPDRAVTSVLGPVVENKVIDANLDGAAVPDSALGPFTGTLAPGCTDDAGRQPSGLCGLWTIGAGTSNGAYNPGLVPPRTVGTPGMGGTAAPGAFTPNKATAVRFLDSIQQMQLQTVGSAYIDYNHKLDDLGVRSALAGVDGDLGNRFHLGPSALWAWYGKWTDKNGNGVIDNFFDGPALPGAQPPLRADEEFVWYGNCNAFPDIPNPQSVAIGFCAYDEDKLAGGTTRMLSYLYPGNHHAYNGGYTADPLLCAGCFLPSDFPGHQAYNFVGANGVPLCVDFQPYGGVAGFNCGTNDLRQFDLADEQLFGDSLLGPQESVAPDGSFHDRTGEPRANTRQWVHGVGWQTFFYDDGLLSNLVQVAAVGCTSDSSNPNRALLGTCRFADVDKFGGLSPEAEALLMGTVKPAARSNWVAFRSAWIPVAAALDGVRNNKAFDLSAITGPLDDQLQNPGLSREPNHPGDAYPGAIRGTGPNGDDQHEGFYNNYDAHKSAAHAFGDLQIFRVSWVLRPIGSGGCVVCVAGAGPVFPYAGEAAGLVPMRQAGDHARTLGPGQYVFAGVFGEWKDKAQTWDEEFLDPTCLTTPVNSLGTCGSAPLPGGLNSPDVVRRNTYVAAPDGWVGNVVNATGTFYYRGYLDEACATDQGVGLKPFGQCHPYLDGVIADPQQIATGEPAHAEFFGRCDDVVGSAIVVHPVDGTWTQPTFVWRNHLGGIDTDVPESYPVPGSALEDFTGRSADIVIDTVCGSGTGGGDIQPADALILPLGNLQESLTTTISVTVGGETLRDTDLYVGWG